jgi:hypothetical protein
MRAEIVTNITATDKEARAFLAALTEWMGRLITPSHIGVKVITYDLKLSGYGWDVVYGTNKALNQASRCMVVSLIRGFTAGWSTGTKWVVKDMSGAL